MTAYASLDLPAGCRGWVCFNTASSPAYPEHRHEELELNLVTGGTAYYLVDDCRVTLGPGTLLWLFPEERHILLGQSADFSMWIAVFTRQLVQAYCRGAVDHFLARRRPAQTACRSLALAEIRVLEGLLTETAAQTVPGAQNTCLGTCLHRAWTLYSVAAERPAAHAVSPAIEKALHLLQDESRAWSLAALAAAVGLSPAWFSRLFKREVGLTLVAYRNRRRLERFLRLRMARPGETLLALCLAAGFGSYAQFHRVHRQVLGQPPRAVQGGGG